MLTILKALRASAYGAPAGDRRVIGDPASAGRPPSCRRPSRIIRIIRGWTARWVLGWL
jgi:hypothetical protein